jgi:hypothetical protein
MSLFSNFVDRNTKDLQKGGQQIIDQTRNVIDQNTDTLTKSNPFDISNIGPIKIPGTTGGGKGAPVTVPVFKMPSYGGIGGGFKVPEINITSPINIPDTSAITNTAQQAVETVTAPAVKAVEQVAKPVEQVAQTAVQAVTPVVESVVDVAKVPVQAVEQITKIDAPKVVESVAKETILAPVKVAETVVKAAEPVVKAATQVVQQPVKAVEQIAKIDAPKVVENVVKQAATTVTETPKMVVQIAENAALKPTSNLAMALTEKAKDALELTWDNIISPFQPGTTEGTVAAEPAAADLDAIQATGNEDPFADMETATTKADKMTEEERLRRIRRLMLNRYGREDTILTGAKDPLNRRRYASAL